MLLPVKRRIRIHYSLASCFRIYRHVRKIITIAEIFNVKTTFIPFLPGKKYLFFQSAGLLQSGSGEFATQYVTNRDRPKATIESFAGCLRGIRYAK
jgi:hypothetical protein